MTEYEIRVRLAENLRKMLTDLESTMNAFDHGDKSQADVARDLVDVSKLHQTIGADLYRLKRIF